MVRKLMAEIADIATAMVDALNGHTFPMAFTATREYAPLADLKDMGVLHVTVVPSGIELLPLARHLAQDDVTVDVAIQQKLKTMDVAESDVLMAMVELIGDYIRQRGTFAPGQWLGATNLPIYSQEHMREMRVFTSVISVTLRVHKQWPG
ncbi:unnamed protein product [marine sediment metagenome]|uniref:Tail terminator n=1 Tax=marine sediment metagenome TaxID=412755 RepID=X0RH81_9ZZZZ